MITLIGIAFFAGVLTVLAPCVLPMLPIIIGGSLQGDSDGARRKPIRIAAGLGLSVLLFTLLIYVFTQSVEINRDTWKTISGIIIIVLGLIMLFPHARDRVAYRLGFGKSQQLISGSQKVGGRTGDFLLGAALGPVFNSCSPVYLLLVTQLPQHSLSVAIVGIIAYIVGLLALLLLIAYTGRSLVQRLRRASDPTSIFKKILAILIIATGLALLTGLDKKVEAMLASSPLTQRLVQYEETLKEQIKPAETKTQTE